MAKKNKLRSMTGYGRADGTNHAASIYVEVRSVNGRGFRLRAKLPPLLTCLQPRLDKLIRSVCSRGNIELYLSYDPLGRGGAGTFDTAALNFYRSQLEDIKRELDVPGEITIQLLASLPGALQTNELSEQELEDLWALVEKVTGEALDKLDQMRVAEGEALKADLDALCSEVRHLLTRVREMIPKAREEYIVRMHKRINDILSTNGVEVQPGDLTREIAIFTERSDISEELARLESHLEQFDTTIETGGDVGRRLEFITQEMHREANTMGGKVNDVQLSRLAIDVKAVVDRLKEQVPNAE